MSEYLINVNFYCFLEIFQNFSSFGEMNDVLNKE
jgi:hypothetical protein